MELKTPREFFEKALPTRFDPSKASDLEIVVQMNITGSNGGDWTITIRDQKIEVKEGVHPSPDITVRMADTDCVDLVNGRLSGVEAFMTGKLEFKGSMAIGMKLIDMGIM
jgi:putative sterol carrier protein